MKLSKALQLLLLLYPGLNSAVYAAEASELFKQELALYSAQTQQLKSIKDVKSDEVKRYRFTGILNFAEYDSLHLNDDGLGQLLDDIKTADNLNDLFVNTNGVFGRAELEGSIKIVLPDENVVTQKEIVLWDSSSVNDTAPEKVSFLQQYLYNVEFEAKGALDIQKLTISCNIVEHDGGFLGGNDTVCNGTQTFNLSQLATAEQTPELLQGLLPLVPTLATKFKSGNHCTINTLQDLIDRVSEEEGDLGITAIIDIINNASGVWLTNPSITDISDSKQKDSKKVHRSIKGNYKYLNNGEWGKIEPYGQMYILPSAHVVSISDAAQLFADALPIMEDSINGALEKLPEIIKNTQLPLDLVDVEPIQIYDHQFSSRSELMRKIKKNHPLWFGGYTHLIDENKQQMVVFSNVWEKDDGLNFDDCISRGYGFGFEALDFNSLAQQNFTGCGKNKDSVVALTLTETKLHQPEEKIENYPWVLDAQYYFVGGDSGKNSEPYGYAYFQLPDGSQQTLFRDDYSGPSSDMYFVNDRSFYTFKKTIKFTGPKHWNPAQGFPLLGSIYENDDNSGDDRYYDANHDMFTPTQEQMDISSAEYGNYGESCGDNGFHKVIRSAKHNQHICIKLTLKPGNEKIGLLP